MSQGAVGHTAPPGRSCPVEGVRSTGKTKCLVGSGQLCLTWVVETEQGTASSVQVWASCVETPTSELAVPADT